MKKKILVLSFGFFVTDVISGIVLGLFGTLHLALGPTTRWQHFAQVLIGN